MNAYTAESQMYTTRLKNAEMLQEIGGDVHNFIRYIPIKYILDRHPNGDL